MARLLIEGRDRLVHLGLERVVRVVRQPEQPRLDGALIKGLRFGVKGLGFEIEDLGFLNLVECLGLRVRS